MGRSAGLTRRRRARRCCAPPGSRAPRLWARSMSISMRSMQEAPLAEPLPPLDAARFMPPVVDRGAGRAGARRRWRCCAAAERPVILMGRVSRDEAAWAARVALAEALRRAGGDRPQGRRGVPDRSPAACRRARRCSRRRRRRSAIADADVMLSLDWVDLAGTLRAACGTAAPAARVIQVSLDHQLHNGWSMDHQALPPVDLFLAADPDSAARAMLDVLHPEGRAPGPRSRAVRRSRSCPGRGRSWWSRWGARCGTRSARGMSRCCICRCPGTARPGRSAIRSISSAPMAAAGSAVAPASRSARRSR